MEAAANEDATLSRIAIAIGEPARTRMLMALLDGRARTSTELAVIAEVMAPTASVHLARLKEAGLVKVAAQGRHRYYALRNENVARALESLSVLEGRDSRSFVPKTPVPLRYARTCYDHIAGTLSVLLHDHFVSEGWLTRESREPKHSYSLTLEGEKHLLSAGVDVRAARIAKRKFAYACLDWSERRAHLAGSLGAALFDCAQRRRWITRDLNSRTLYLTKSGEQEIRNLFGLHVSPSETAKVIGVRNRQHPSEPLVFQVPANTGVRTHKMTT